MRTFIAVDLEDEEIRKKLERIQEELENTGAILKLVEPWNLHVTLKFLGEIDDTKVSEVTNKLKEFKAAPFKATLRGLGAFPNEYRPRVVFVHIESKEFEELMRQIDLAMYDVGFPLEKRGYVPHLTLARVKARGYLLEKVLRKYEEETIGEIYVNEIRLKKSKLTPQGPIYSTLFSLKLEG